MPRLSLRQVRKPDFGRVRARNGIALGAIAAVALTVGLLVAELPSSTKAAAPAGKISGSATVQRRDLVATDTEAGTLSYANPQTVFDRLTGTVTWLPAVGALVKPGGTLFKVNGSPVVLFDGTTPAYRDLSSADTDGADIQELNADLKALGYDPNHDITVDNVWQAATTTAVEAWQTAHGMTETGTITFGQIVFLPGPQRITTVNTVLGSDGSASSAGAGSGSGASLENVGKPKPEFVDLTTTSTTPTVATGPAPVSPTPATATSAAVTPTTTTTTTTTTTAPVPPTTTTTTTTTPNCNGLDVPQQNPNLALQKQIQATKALLAACNNKSGKNGTPSVEAVLLALLKAETLELKKTLGASGNAGGTGGTSGAGGGGKGGGGGGTGGGTASPGGGGGSGTGSGGGSGTGSGGGGSGTGSGGGSGTGSGGGGSGTGSGAAQAILDTTSTNVIVTVDLDATKQTEAVVGEPVTVEMPAGNTVNGKITAVSPIAVSSSSNSGSGSGGGGGNGGSSTPSATIPVTVTLHGKLPKTGLDQAAVSVNFQQQKANNVLSVPVTALVATAGGGYAVQQAASPHRLIAVTPGLFAAGYVQISGAQIYPGLQVTDSQG